MAHELNTPLAVLNGSIEKLIETSPDAQTLNRLARMQRVTQRLRRISESLVDFARVRKQNMEPLALRALIDEAWSLVAIDEKASSVELVNEVGAEAQVVGNSDRLAQVFVNLLRNALNAVEAGTRADRGALPPRGEAGRSGDRRERGGQRSGHSGRCAAGYLRGLRHHASGRSRDRPGIDRGRRHRHAARWIDHGQQSGRRRGLPGSVAAGGAGGFLKISVHPRLRRTGRLLAIQIQPFEDDVL